ncbi:MAG: SAM-dependent methyltransferase [Burkholderiales bacterium]|nr:SAM-dependent methyltransferase [Burkholderiales bacterium]
MTAPVASRVGRLLLVPNALDQGSADDVTSSGAALHLALPMAVLQTAAALEYWVTETPKVARVFLKRVNAVTPLVRPLQELVIAELPRPRKGGASRGTTGADAGVSAQQWAQLLEPTRQGHDVGLLSDAGLPAVADPGAELVRAAHLAGIEVVPLAGPSALLLALAASGLNGQSFAFVGYLPVEAGERAKRLQELEAISRRARQTQLFIETPYRNSAMLDTLLASLAPQTSLSVSCGLTTPQGWTRTATVAGWRKQSVVMPNDLPAVFALLA